MQWFATRLGHPVVCGLYSKHFHRLVLLLDTCSTGEACQQLCLSWTVSCMAWLNHLWLQAYQLFKARAYGADAVLLIAAVLPNNDLEYLIASARKMKLQCLIEVRQLSAVAALCMIVKAQ